MNFFSNSIIYTLSNIFNRGIPFLLLPILTKYLSPEEFGQVAMFLVTMMLVMPLVGCCSNSVLTQRYFRMTVSGKKLFVNDMMKLLFVGMLFLFVVVLLIGGWLQSVVQLSKGWMLISVLCASLGMFSTILLTLYQLKKEVYSYALFQGFASLLNVSLSLLFVVLLGLGWEGRANGIFISSLLMALITFFIIYKKNLYQPKYFFLRSPYLMKIFKLGLAIIPASIAGWAMVMTDRVFISSMLGLNAVGIYAVALYFGQAGEIIMTSIGRAWMPFYFSSMASGKPEEQHRTIRTTYLLCLLYVFIALILAIAGPLVFELFVDDEYFSGKVIIPWLAFSFCCIAVMGLFSFFLMDIKRNDVISRIYIFVLVLNIGLNYVMINAFGIVGAAQATALANFLGLLVTVSVTIVMRKNLRWIGERSD